MKVRFSTIDIQACISEIKTRLAGMRVANVYDLDNKTYLIRLAKPDSKAMILLESGNRIHTTDFEWPKNMTPSGFSMKLRKHLRGRRLEKIEQLGVDRIIDLQFGSNEAAYHVILELYDRGNIVLTDYEYTILNILRQRTDESQDVKFAVREKYPLDLAKQYGGPPSAEQLTGMMTSAKEGDNLKRVLNPQLAYGPALIDHCLRGAGITDNARVGKEFKLAEDLPKLVSAMEEADTVLKMLGQGSCKGYIIQRKEKRPNPKEGEPAELLIYHEFHPFLFRQHENSPHVEFETFDKAVDDFFSKMESQKLDTKALQQEKLALKKLENVKKDHDKRLDALHKEQENDMKKAQLIEMNLTLVDRALMTVQSAIANQIDWTEIHNLVKEATLQGDPVAGAIKGLKLDTNHITMLLKDPYMGSGDELEDDEDIIKPMKLDIDLGLSAYANARKFYDMKRTAAKKEQKTMDASGKALKSAEKKTKQTLKEVAVSAKINKARKTYWFEKFLWFISSENYLVIGGRDQQQNELIVKRYLKAGDLYVHADLHGASSVVIKNPSGLPVPPKTLNEAGTMAICMSAAWDAKVVTSAWWVRHDQVSKTAPTGEYLTTGSFMIRGKKNFLPPSYLVYGFSFVFKLDESCVENHRDERKVRTADEDAVSMATESDITDEASLGASELADISESDDDDDNEDNNENDNPVSPNEDLQQESPRTEESAESNNSKLDTGSEVEPQADSQKDVIISEAVIREDTVEGGVDSDQEESMFPDTTIALQHVMGEKFKLKRGTSNISTASSTETEGEHTVFMGDANPVVLGGKGTNTGRLSAKQRREMKRKAKQANAEEEVRQEGLERQREEEAAKLSQEPRPQSGKGTDKCQSQMQDQQPKRGQKAKMKKIKEKYKDQDEEERRLRMEILGSAGGQKEDKKKKGKKGKQQEQQQKAAARQQKQQQGQGRPKKPLTIDDIKQEVQSLALEEENEAAKSSTGKVKDEEEEQPSDEEKEESAQGSEDMNIINSLTGQPLLEDEMMFCIPVVAPYSALLNYKYKVKLTPGTTKRGKAARTALNMFTHDKNASPREKELFRSVKDADLSRNFPGKVKVSAPNLQKQKHK